MDNESGSEIEVRDFAANNDIRPVSDPNIFSETQRLAQAQAVLQMASSAPQLYDLRAAHRRVLKQLKVPAINEILPDPDGIKESNPALENVAMSMGRPAAAYPDQDHISHIKIHLAYAQDPNYGGSPLIGPVFAPQALEHIKQHLTLHYLQSMRAYVAEAAGGEDTLKLHEEKPLRIEDQQALALAAEMVSQDAQQLFGQAQQQIQGLAQKVQQAKQAAMQQAAESDPTAQVILKTQMAETERKAKESEAKMQLEVKKIEQDSQIKIAELQQQVQELIAKYETQTKLDANKNATAIALANINNAADERIAMINHGASFNQMQMQLEHEQNMSAVDAINAADQDIRQHGISIQQQALQREAQQVQDAIARQREAEMADRQHQQTMEQNYQQAHNQMIQNEQQNLNQTMQAEQQQAMQQPQPKPTGEV
jgi:hypothetical protein